MPVSFSEPRREWILKLAGGDEVEQLQQLPGIRIDLEKMKAYGKVDAIAAAAVRLGQEPPEKPEAMRVNIVTPGLYRYQQEGVDQLVQITHGAGGALLADDPGLGKTRQAVEAIRARGGRALVICPASVRESWRSELAKLGVNCAILGPPSDKHYTKEWEIAHKATVVVTSYEMMARACEVAFPTDTPRTLVFDEAHLLCGRDTKRSTDAGNLAALATYKIGLTATPMWSRPRDFYKLLTILLGRRLGSSFEFDVAYCAGVPGEYGGIVNKGVSRADELKLRLSYYMVRRTKAEVGGQMPKLTRTVQWLDGNERATNAFVGFETSRRGFHHALAATLEAKIQAAVDLAVQAKKFLLVTWLKDHAEQMGALIEKNGVPCFVITGDMSHLKRAETIAAARASGAGIVATLDSIGTGVDGLQYVASYGIAHAIDPTPLKLIQVEGRLDRIGQTEPINWVYLALKDSADELVVHIAVEKLDHFRSIVPSAAVQTGLRNELSDTASDPDAEKETLRKLYDALD